MSKPPEEGQIWEWRGFGTISPEIAAQVESLPIRNGIRDLPGMDLYLIPPISEQNVKLRLTDRGWVLKFKRLLEKQPGGIELYHETERWTYSFPITLTTIKNAADLLGVTLPEATLPGQLFSEEQIIASLRAATPPIVAVETRKVRSQYQFAGGWLEIANVIFGERRTQS